MRIDVTLLLCLLMLALLVALIILTILREMHANDLHKRAMLAPWFCVRCGYRVHATPAERCPECGEPIPPKFPHSHGR